MIALVADHEARGVSLLIERYRKPDSSALLASWLHEVQAAENALWELLTERTVANAEGAQLDMLGRIVGQPREGRSDDVYRVWIAARVLVSRSSGKTEQLIAIAKKLVDSEQVELEEYYPASFVLRVEGIDAVVGLQVAQLLALAKPAGVGMHFVWAPEYAGESFTFAPGDETMLGSPLGFGAGALAAVSDGSFGSMEFAEFVEVPADALTHGGEPLTHVGEYLTHG